MKRLLSAIMLLTATTLFFCGRHPSGPLADPDDAVVEFLTGDTNHTVQIGTPLQMGLVVSRPLFVDTIHLTSSCGGFDTTLSPDPVETADTLYFYPVFSREGTCTVYARAILYEKEHGEKTDSLSIEVRVTPEKIVFTRIPQDFATFVGRADTLFFIATINGDSSSIQFSISSDPPLETAHLYPITAFSGDIGRYVFMADTADTFTITVGASSGALSDSVKVGVRVYDVMAFASIDVPPLIITGVADTLVFTIDRKERPDSLRMEFINGSAFDTATVKVAPSAVDSLLIIVTPQSEGTLPIVVRITNGGVSDTSWFLVKTVDPAYAIWNNTTVDFKATEGVPLAVDLREYLFKPVTEGITLSSDFGRVSMDTLWKWSPPWGCDSVITAIISAEKEGGINLLHLNLSIIPGDSSQPLLQLADTSFMDKILAASRIAIEVIASDTGAGMDKVTFGYNSKTIDAIPSGDNIYIGIVDGLSPGIRTAITVTAYDRSMRKNHSELGLYLTYDSTMKDDMPPSIIQIEGPVDNTRVMDLEGRITCRITDDDAGVDSVWWTFNDNFAATLTNAGNNEYPLLYTIDRNGENRIVVHARDGALNHNGDSLVITLVYNTEPERIDLSGPDDGAIEVDILPTFAWRGGSDSDGDIVYFRVLYGTSFDSLTMQSHEVTDGDARLARADKLSPGTMYYWRVIGYTLIFPDTVWSEVYSFTTGNAPEVTVVPDSAVVMEGDSITFSAIATGSSLLSYRWLKNGESLQGKRSEVCTIEALLEDSGAIIHCRVSNAFGEDTSEGAVLTVLPLPRFTVAFECDGGTAVDTQVVRSGDHAIEPAPSPTKEGCVFGGWFTTSSLDVEFDFDNTPITEHIRLYAKWIVIEGE